jgi:hypothetical protein
MSREDRDRVLYCFRTQHELKQLRRDSWELPDLMQVVELRQHGFTTSDIIQAFANMGLRARTWQAMETELCKLRKCGVSKLYQQTSMEINTQFGTLRRGKADGQTYYSLQCPCCKRFGTLDDDQLHGRISVDHSGEPYEGGICTYHETHDFYAAIAGATAWQS